MLCRPPPPPRAPSGEGDPGAPARRSAKCPWPAGADRERPKTRAGNMRRRAAPGAPLLLAREGALLKRHMAARATRGRGGTPGPGPCRARSVDRARPMTRRGPHGGGGGSMVGNDRLNVPAIDNSSP